MNTSLGCNCRHLFPAIVVGIDSRRSLKVVDCVSQRIPQRRRSRDWLPTLIEGEPSRKPCVSSSLSRGSVRLKAPDCQRRGEVARTGTRPPQNNRPVGTVNPFAQLLRRTTKLLGSRTDRRPLRAVLPSMIQHHTNSPLPHLRWIHERSSHDSIISQLSELPGKPVRFRER